LKHSLRVLIAGGGTGGHIIPAIAVARELTRNHNGEILFLGTERGLETRLVPQAGYPLELIHVGQLKNVSLLTRARTLLDLPLSLWRCRQLLRSFRPHVVVGVGGYASGPAMAAAVFDRLPTLAFEPNAYPGLANRIIGKHVSAAAVNFPPAAKFFRNAEVTGIPVREEFLSLPARTRGAPPHLLVFGGSQGARSLNMTMPKIAAQLLGTVAGLTILHQSGPRQLEATRSAYLNSRAPGDRYRVSAFLDDMPLCFAAADLVLARSGASTVAELAAAGKPSLLVPFPRAADDHQRKNADVMVKAGAAELLLESNLNEETLLAALVALFADRERLTAMSLKARSQAHPEAASKIAERIAELAVKKGRYSARILAH
jgi:UDP-N-acetylglucosamine--N-acetylmuramyl-(pentapeptide) pyrophosphoryl-undecaprenol N-acetylglucosamine transferase